MQTSGNTVLITGGGSGIGLSLTKAFLNQGNKVIICGRTLEKLEKVKADYPGLEIIQCDVQDDEQIKAMLEKCNSEYGGIDVLVNNAGVFESFSYTGEPFPIEKQMREINIDFSAPIRMVHYFLPDLMKKSNPAIVNVSSGLGFVPLAGAPIYCATKAGIHSWTRSLRWQLKSTNVKVFELMPPLVDTPMVSEFKNFPMMDPEVLVAKFMKGFARDKYTITPGQASQLKMMSRFAPKFIFKALNKQFTPK